jgi:ribose 5-phosphate isomerase B
MSFESSSRGTIALGAVAPSPVVDAVRTLLDKRGLTVVDVSQHEGRSPTWPEVGREVAEVVASGDATSGIALCWTGSGVAISASTVTGCRSAFCSSSTEAGDARSWHDANVLALSLSAPVDTAINTVRAWLDTSPSEDCRHIGARESFSHVARAAA